MVKVEISEIEYKRIDFDLNDAPTGWPVSGPSHDTHVYAVCHIADVEMRARFIFPGVLRTEEAKEKIAERLQDWAKCLKL